MNPTARTNDLTGAVLDGRYELHAAIGEGAFGRVYRGLDRRLARTVAVKVIKSPWSDDSAWVESFEHEAQMLARISDPGVVQIFDVGHAPEGLYYVAELVDGESLATRLKRGPLEHHEACDIAEQLCRALAHAHEQRVVHRDIKPANILISSHGRVKVGDFGVARLAESTTEIPAAAVVGTPKYMAPEQALGRRATPAVDIYSAGVVLYEMLVGRPPFDGSSAVEFAMRHAYDRPEPLPPEVPRDLANVVVRALAKQPDERYRDAGSMAEALASTSSALSSAGRIAFASGAHEEMRTVSLAMPVVGERVEAQRAGEERAGEKRAGEERAGEERAGEERAGEERAGEERAGEERAGEERAGEERAGTERAAASEGAVASERAVAEHAAAQAEPAQPARSNRATAATNGVDRTRIAPVLPPAMAPDTETSPAARRRNLAILAIGCAIVLAMIAGAILLPGAAPPSVSTPKLTGLTQSGATAKARRAGLRIRFSQRNATAPTGIAIAQTPLPGVSAPRGSLVSVTLSDGPPPVPVPSLVNQNVTSARTVLTSVGLLTNVDIVAAPGITPGIVVRQDPASGYLRWHGTVTLSVAETPSWRLLTSLSGSDGGHTVPFSIIGTRFRMVYTMSYNGLCTLIFFCDGPTARVVNLRTGASVAQFGLQDGGTRTQLIDSGAGLYQVTITPGSDSASWSLRVDDYY
ncbi:MAG: protein kinase domain-containing protein [Solirubrobacteraceae bacterium]